MRQWNEANAFIHAATSLPKPKGKSRRMGQKWRMKENPLWKHFQGRHKFVETTSPRVLAVPEPGRSLLHRPTYYISL